MGAWCAGNAAFPASALADCFGFFLCGYLLQVALWQTLSYTHVHTWLPTWTHSLMAFQCGGRKRVYLDVKFALIGLGAG